VSIGSDQERQRLVSLVNRSAQGGQRDRIRESEIHRTAGASVECCDSVALVSAQLTVRTAENARGVAYLVVPSRLSVSVKALNASS